MRIFFLSAFIALTNIAQAQDNGFPFGAVKYQELDMKYYAADSLAEAVYLQEFGEIFFDLESFNKVYFIYHAKIKILKEEGKKYADFVIPLYNKGGKEELVRNVKASSFNRDGSKWKETAMQSNNIFRERADENVMLTKFAIPNVQVGSVIEVYWEFETPYIYNLVPIKFQGNIPKMKSEFWVKYPAYYQYNASLKGYHPLSKNEGILDKSCARLNGSTADCSFFKYAMENVPAFREEAYMTARENFESAIKFELEQVNHPDGKVDKVTSDWKSAERELKEHADFGVQIRKARNLFEDKVRAIKSEPDKLKKATQIFDVVKKSFTWNGEIRKYTEEGVKKALETGKANSAEINLALCGALQEADFTAEPVLIATRENGLPITAYPVLSDFNYVIVRLEIEGKEYLLDATSRLNPFGFVHERCLNGQGRAVGATANWIDIKPSGKHRMVFDSKLTLSAEGDLTGSYTITSQGYAGRGKRFQFFDAADKQAFLKSRTEKWTNIKVTKAEIENENDIDKSFVEKYELALESDVPSANIIYFNPFLTDRTEKNPFVSKERNYPVDFGAPFEEIYLQTLELPANYVVEELPKSTALALPANGGRLTFNMNQNGNKITMASTILLSKPVYSNEEYHGLRELYARYISVLESQVVLKRR